MKYQTLYLIRHAESQMSGKYCGSSDVGLSDLGLEQAQKLGVYFRTIPVDVCWTSQLKRARQTAEILKQERGMPILQYSDLGEIHFGEWEGHEFSYVQEQWPLTYNQWIQSPATVQIPQGESFMDFSSRVKRLGKELERAPETNLVVIGHGGSLALLLMFLLKKPEDQFWNWVMTPASITILQKEEPRNANDFEIVRFKDSSYL